MVASPNDQQELKHRRSNRSRKNNSDSRDRNIKSPSHNSGVSNLKAVENIGANSVEESGSNTSRRKQKVFHKQPSSLKQRFFSSNFRNHGTSRNSHGIISESPPSNSVGFFFASTPPENHGSVQKFPVLITVIWLFIALFFSEHEMT